MADRYPQYLIGQGEIELLTQKELEVIRGIAEGYTNTIIAKQLNISTATVKFHIANIFKN